MTSYAEHADDDSRIRQAEDYVREALKHLREVKHERVPGNVDEAYQLLVDVPKLLMYAHTGKPGGGPWPWRRR